MLVDEANVRIWRDRVLADRSCTQKAHVAPIAGHVFGVVPSKTLGNNLTRPEFFQEVASRLGVDVLEGHTSCPFCSIRLVRSPAALGWYWKLLGSLVG